MINLCKKGQIIILGFNEENILEKKGYINYFLPFILLYIILRLGFFYKYIPY